MSDENSPTRSPVENFDPNRQLFLLQVYLESGRDLAVKDASGSSDPYVKFLYKNKLVYRSNTIFKNVNPQWDEKFTHVLDDVSQPLRIEVYDYDRFSDDDFMGCASVDLLALDANVVESKVILADKKNNDRNLGYLVLRTSLVPATETAAQLVRNRHTSSQAEEETAESKTKRRSGIRKATKMWTDLVRIVLVEARNMEPINPNKNNTPPDAYVKFKLGTEKCKSKIVYKTWRPSWLEQFSLHTRNDQSKILEVGIIDNKKDTSLGRCAIDLSLLKKGHVEKRWYPLDNGSGDILLSLSVTGKLASRTVSADAEDGALHPFDNNNIAGVIQSYDLKYTLKNVWDVGYLTVKVHKARALAAADIGNSSDPFCAVELVNARLETHTEHKTKNPDWNTVFTFYVNDINTVLEVTVYDEDRYMKSEFMGKVAVPLLNIKNNEQVWIPLKNQSLTRRVKGEILLEMNLVWNPIRAAVATILPQERKYGVKEEPFRRRVFIRNIERLNRFVLAAYQWYLYFQLCLTWECPQRSGLAFLFLLAIAYCLQPCLFPIAILALFAAVYIQKRSNADTPDGPDDQSETDDEDDNTDDKNWKIIRGYIQQKEVSLAFGQNMLDFFATMIERAKNILEFKQPYVSWMAVLSLACSVVMLYFIPLNWIAVGWVIKKFTRKFRRPHSVPSNELLDFISRAPSDKELNTYYGYK